MIAIDTNILVYAHRSDNPFFAKAVLTLTEIIDSNHAWAIPWPCFHEFFAVVTHPRIYKTPTPRSTALAQIDNLIACPTLEVLTETPAHWSVLKELVEAGSIDGPKVHDARIAAICIENAVSQFYSCDRDFSRFKDLPVKNPLV